MIQEDYVSYEQAVKLKELGFKDKCNAYYWTEDKAFDCTNCIVHKNSDTCQTVVMAPSLWQAQKWLREVKRIIVEPHFQYESVFRFVVQSESRCIYKLFDEHSKTYELALSAGIDAALGLLTDTPNKII